MSCGMKPAEEPKVYDLIKKIGDEVNSVLNKRMKEKYFDNIILLYSFIENLLKWLIYVNVVWKKCGRALLPSEEVISGKEVESIEKICGDLRFYDSLQIALLIDLVDLKLYRRIDRIRYDRNNLIHQFWIYTIRDDFRELRRKLLDLVGVANELVRICKKLSKEMSPDLLWLTSLPRRRK